MLPQGSLLKLCVSSQAPAQWPCGVLCTTMDAQQPPAISELVCCPPPGGEPGTVAKGRPPVELVSPFGDSLDGGKPGEGSPEGGTSA
jgi:hypothetical protein